MVDACRREEVLMSSSSTSRSIPTTMRAVVIDRYGEPEEVMHTATVPLPKLDDRSVLIDVRTAGVGTWDPYLCRGEVFAESGFPKILGSDGAGVVVAAGSKARRFHVGDRVYAYG
jgi:NADPH:quinone reductase-like Zn-dependent oxidoreductase